jgi:serine/threonine protein kinase
MAASGKTCATCGERFGPDVLFCPKDGTPLGGSRAGSTDPPDRDPYIGVELPGQIRLRQLVGIGSMGRVYRAFQGGIERDVAVKILHRELSANGELVARFHREAKIASRLVHPNVVQVLMTGALPDDGRSRVGGELYLVMEHLDGISLLTALAAAGGTEGDALPLARALHVGLQLCDAVGEAHAQGIVHRDLKPENVMLVRRGEDPDFVKVLDFGIARLDWAGSLATQAGLIFGTAKYMSPEGAEGRPVGPEADVYSLATILFQCLSGRTPFEGESPVALLLHHTSTTPPDLRSIPRASYVPSAIASTIMQNLSKTPGDRAKNARAFGRDLISAARASGLDPERIALPGGLAYGGGSLLRLVSKERTKAHDLSADLAAKIGGRAAPQAPPPPADGEPSRPRHDLAPPSGPGSRPAGATVPGEPAFTTPLPPPSSRTLIDPDLAGIVASRRSSPGLTNAPGSAPESSKRVADLDWDDAGGTPAPASVQPAHATMQGAEIPRPPPAEAGPSVVGKLVRVVLIAAAAAALVVGGLAGAQRLRAPAADEEPGVEAFVEQARGCIRARAWDAPAEPNFRAVTQRAEATFPGDPRITSVKNEAAERIVADALGLKYAGDLPNALRLARLAAELAPELSSARHLVRELEPTIPNEPTSTSASASASAAHPPRPAPRATAEAAPSAPTPAASASAGKPAATSLSARQAPTPSSGPVLPPSPPPLPSGHGPSGNSGGPWL